MSIFTRSLSDDLASLVKQIDTTVGKNDDVKMAAFVVLLTDDPSVDAAKLKALAEKHGITNTPLTVFKDTKGPKSYKIAKDAEVTVMMWHPVEVKGKIILQVKANYAFAKGKLNKKSTAKVVADTSKILE